MFNLTIPKNRRWRIWTSYPLIEESTISSVEMLRLACEPNPMSIARYVAVEYLQAGGMNPYGLLGGHFQPSNAREIVFYVNTSPPDGSIFAHSLAGKLDIIRQGLPHEFALSILQGASRDYLSSLLGSGALHFDCACHGEIGFSNHVFELLSRVLVRLLTIDLHFAPVSELTYILEDVINSYSMSKF